MINTTLGKLNIYVNDGNYGNIYPDSSAFLNEGVPFISASDFVGKNFNYKDIKHISKELHDTLLTKGHIQKDDILIVVRGNGIGKVGMLKDELSDCNINAQLAFIRLLDDEVDADYLYYLLSMPSNYEVIRRFGSGSAQPQLPINRMLQIPLSMIEGKEKRKKIGAFLALLDKKIANNNAINAELESMAKTIYDYWFLQFEFPNEEGKPYKSSGGKMVWNEELKREIPEGWGTGNLYDIADFVNGLACQKFRPIDDNKLPVIKITEMHDGITENTEFVKADIPEKNIIDDGDILFSWSATLEVMIWNGGRGGLNQHIFKVSPKNYPKYYVFMQLSAYVINFIKMAEARKTTMGHITTEHLKQSKIILPPKVITERFNEEVSDMFQMIINNNIQNRELASFRDFLLPLLMNGQVGFKELSND